jgi:transcriptional regulator with XRE-family HTH domain
MDFEKSLKYLVSKGVTAYEIAEAMNVNESGIRRVLNGKVVNPQRKTKEVIILYAKKLSEEKTFESTVNDNEVISKDEIIKLLKDKIFRLEKDLEESRSQIEEFKTQNKSPTKSN